MTLQNLLDKASPQVLQRGKKYFTQGKVLKLQKNPSGSWVAAVKGSGGNYQVYITADAADDVRHFQCDCTYASVHTGEVCKHIVALALVLEQQFGQGQPPVVEPQPAAEQPAPKARAKAKTPQEPDWEKLVASATPKDLRAFLITYGKFNPEFRHQIGVAFSRPTGKGQDNIAYYRRQLKEIFTRNKRGGFLDYGAGLRAMQEVVVLSRKIAEYFAQQQYQEAFSVAAAIVMECGKAIQQMDDSSGSCGDEIFTALADIEHILQATDDAALKEQIFDWLQQQVENPDYSNYGVEGPERVYFKAAAWLHKQEAAHRFIEQKIAKAKPADRKYIQEGYVADRIALLQSEGREKEAERLIDQHLHKGPIRQMRIDSLLAAGDVAKAEALLLEVIQRGEQAYDKARAWKEQLLALYQRDGQDAKYRQLAQQLFLAYGDLKFFRLYKKTVPSADWLQERARLLEEAVKVLTPKYGFAHHLAEVYIDEQMKDALLELLGNTQDIKVIVQYTDYLKEQYAAQLLPCYQRGIELLARQSERKVYVQLVRYLRKMAQLEGGLPAAKALKESLLEQYKKRPSMREEFEALLWG